MRPANDFHLTQDGVLELETELMDLKKRRKYVAEQLKTAKEQGDLSENSDWTSAQDEHKYIENRIAEIEHILRNVKLIDHPKSTQSVELGATVELDCEGRNSVYTIVGSLESDPEENKISDESPIGRALLGRSVGDTVQVQVPSGMMNCQIKKIR